MNSTEICTAKVLLRMFLSTTATLNSGRKLDAHYHQSEKEESSPISHIISCKICLHSESHCCIVYSCTSFNGILERERECVVCATLSLFRIYLTFRNEIILYYPTMSRELK